MTPIHVVRLDLVATDFDAGTAAVQFAPRRPLHFTAGQHGLWAVPGGGAKPFTFASAPEEDLLTLGTELSSGSRFKRALGALRIGGTVHLIGPLGRFTLESTSDTVVMLAQGMGVTPFRSMLRHTRITGAAKRTTLVHVGAPHAFRGDTEAAADEASYPSSRQEFMDEITAVVLAQPDATFMVAGAPVFVRATVRSLTGLGVPPAQIRRNLLHGYSAGAPHHRYRVTR
jgi:glycine betaine catabolism B